MTWTKEQEQAINAEGTNIIVSAGAGSGKTAVLTARVQRKLLSGIHINWSLHMQITVIKTTRLMGYCFPQGYYSDSISNDNIISKIYINNYNHCHLSQTFLQELLQRLHILRIQIPVPGVLVV